MRQLCAEPGSVQCFDGIGIGCIVVNYALTTSFVRRYDEVQEADSVYDHVKR